MQQQDVKMRILTAARKLFAKQGFDRTTVRQICEEAGANVALVSYYFGGKENLFAALFSAFFPGYKLSENEEILQEPVEGIKFIIREVLRFRLEEPEMARIIQQELTMNSPRTKIIVPYVIQVWSKLEELLKKGHRQGIFRYNSVHYTVLLIMGAVIFPHSAQVHSVIASNQELSFEERVEETIQFVLGGLGYEPDN